MHSSSIFRFLNLSQFKITRKRRDLFCKQNKGEKSYDHFNKCRKWFNKIQSLCKTKTVGNPEIKGHYLNCQRRLPQTYRYITIKGKCCPLQLGRRKKCYYHNLYSTELPGKNKPTLQKQAWCLLRTEFYSQKRKRWRQIEVVCKFDARWIITSLKGEVSEGVCLGEIFPDRNQDVRARFPPNSVQDLC